MSAQSIAAVITAATALIAAVTALLHSLQTRRVVTKHKANPYVHAGQLAEQGTVDSAGPATPRGQQPPYNMVS